MGRQPRMYRPDLAFESVSVTIGNSFALRPCKESTEVIVGVYGRALELYPAVSLHALNPISNQLTELVSSTDPWQLRLFYAHTRCNISKEIKRLHGLPFPIFKKRVAVLPIENTVESQERRLCYVLSQGTKEDLVESPRDWLGVTGVHQLERNEPLVGWWFDRSAEYNARARGKTFGKYDFATRYELELKPLPAWAGLEDWRGRVTELVDDIEATNRARREDEGKSVLGWERVASFAPTHFPTTFKNTPSPMVLAATPSGYVAMRRVYREFCDAFHRASAQMRANPKIVVEFPPYSFPPGSVRITRGRSDDLSLAFRPG